MKQISIGDKVFNVSKKLGKGSYGQVYQTNKDGKEYALKVIKNPAREGVKSLRELDIMSRLSHPHLMDAKMIVSSCCPKSKKTKQKQSKVGILMDLAERDLHTAMYDKNFSIESRLKVLKQVTQALQFLHQCDYLHMDIKPLNILLFENNKVGKLTDFGLALRTENGAYNEKYKDYPIELVTVSHRSYNILKGDRHYTAADDMWSLGITFFEVLTGGHSLFSELKDPEYTKENVLKIIENKLSIDNIDNTLRPYFWNVKKKIKQTAINLIRDMLHFDPLRRPSLSLILASPLFKYSENRNIKTEVEKEDKIGGHVKNFPILSPVVCDEMTYEGFDVLVRLCTRISVKLETFYLAADIYQRSLGYQHLRVGTWEQDYNNTVFQACLALYMAIKTIESYFADIKRITELAGNLFPANHLLKGESVLINLFEGKIYANNLFTNSTTFPRLQEGFNLSRDCHVYRYINLSEWKVLNDEEAVKNNIYQDKWGQFIPFFIKTNYYPYLTDSTLSYISELFKKDSERKI